MYFSQKAEEAVKSESTGPGKFEPEIRRGYWKRKEGKRIPQYDDEVLRCFLENQLQLFPERVAETLEEAEDFLEECMAVVVDSVEEVIEYFEEEGIDMEGAAGEEILEADEVFDIGDGRYLIVEG